MILTAGDSFTYGEELPDRQKSAWPYLIAKDLGTTVLNLAEPGGSNDTMVRLVVEQTCKQRFELVVVGWTSPGRFEVWSDLSNSPVTVMHDSETGLPWTEDYYKYSYNQSFSYSQWFQQILLLQQYLKSIEQPFLFVNVCGLYDEDLQHKDITQHIDAETYPGWPKQGMIQWAADAPRAPGGHPLELGHERIANEIKKYIRH